MKQINSSIVSSVTDLCKSFMRHSSRDAISDTVELSVAYYIRNSVW